MNDKMQPQPFAALISEALAEYEQQGTVFHIKPRIARGGGSLFGRALEAPLGPAAGPHTQLAGNIIAAYAAGARFFELKTVQQLDGEKLSIAKPCISGTDEFYNVEWSSELSAAEAAGEYIKAYYALCLLSREWGLGAPDGFIFNMSVGYDLPGLQSAKMDGFIEVLKNAADTQIWQDIRAWTEQNLALFRHIDAAYLDSISPHICTSATISTLHGCPPQQIESIACWLLKEKGLHTFIKCNPTLLGYARTRAILDITGWQDISLIERHFQDDLQLADAVPLFRRVAELAAELKLTLGLKLTNTLPVLALDESLAGEERYMSGRPLYPLTVALAAQLAEATGGRLPISMCGGVDAHNITALYQAGIAPLTMSSNVLKPGGYQRFSQLAELVERHSAPPLPDSERLQQLFRLAQQDEYYQRRSGKRKLLPGAPPLFDCFAAPCVAACPLGQNIPAYLTAIGAHDLVTAAAIIMEQNPLPHLTGSICPHPCMDSCNRGFYERPLHIPGCKLLPAPADFAAALPLLSAAPRGHRHAAIIGGGPAGLAAAILLARAGWRPTIYEAGAEPGGLPERVIPDFRLDSAALAQDIELARQSGVLFRCGQRIEKLEPLLLQTEAIIVAVGAGRSRRLDLSAGEAIPALDFLRDYKNNAADKYSGHICVAGGGNSAIDAARAALRLPQVSSVTLLYRRERQHMPAFAAEIAAAEQEGLHIRTLLQPLELQPGQLLCEKLLLGAPDDSGRPTPQASGQHLSLPCTTLIAALGEQSDVQLYESLGLELDEKGWPLLDELGQSSRPGVYVIGDGARGPATVVEAIADAQKAVSAITGFSFDARPGYSYQAQARRGFIQASGSGAEEAQRCLECASFCALCVECCPNRANRIVETEQGRQILHLDALCNSCGNCASFCPYQGAPYQHKLTQFSGLSEFEMSEQDGFLPLTDCDFLLRHQGRRSEYHWPGEAPPDNSQLLTALRPYFRC